MTTKKRRTQTATTKNRKSLFSKRHLSRKVGLIAIVLAALTLLIPYLPKATSKPVAKPTLEKGVQENKRHRYRMKPTLTDVAPLPREVDPMGRDLNELELPPIERHEAIYPPDFDPHHPPAWTEPLAHPDLDPEPPDPFTPPPIKVDPRRIRPVEDQ